MTARRRLAAALAAAFLAAAPSPLPAAAGSEDAPPAVSDAADALTIGAGTRARRQVVAIGRDVVVAGEALSDVAAVDGSVTVTGRVAGDVIVLSGDARIGPTAVVGGDLFVVGGEAEVAPGASLGGRTVAAPTASAAWLTLVEGPTLGLGATDPLVIGTKLALLAAWMALTLLLFAAGGREMLATADTVRTEPFRAFAVGLTAVLAAALTALAFGAFAPPVVGAPLVALVVLFALVAKLWGMVAVFHAFGGWLARRLGRPRPPALNAATYGLLVLGVLKFLPVAGAWAWTVASLIGVGATLTSKFGRGEPWFRLADLDAPAPLR